MQKSTLLGSKHWDNQRLKIASSRTNWVFKLHALFNMSESDIKINQNAKHENLAWELIKHFRMSFLSVTFHIHEATIYFLQTPWGKNISLSK